MPTGVESRHEDKEFREETGKRRDTCKREQAQCHDEGLFRVRAVESVVVVHGKRTGVLLYGNQNGKGTEISHQINGEIEHQRSDTLRRSAHHGQHQITGLRDRGEGHETFQILLSDGEEVSHSDRSNDDPHQGMIPSGKQGLVHRENLYQHREEHEGGTSL